MNIHTLSSFAILALVGGCNSSTPNGDDKHGHPHAGPPIVTQTYNGTYPIRVVCTTGMVAELVRNIGKERVEIVSLMGSGVDPHTYKAVPGDVTQLNNADIIFYSGLHLEGKMGDVFVRMARKKPTFAVTEFLDEKSILETADGAFDPHLWFDVSLWSQTAGVVRDVLKAYDPPHAAEYQSNADAYQAELKKVDDESKTQLAEVPESQRVLITSHDAFRYFGRAYKVEVRGIQGISTESEAGVREINELVDFIVSRKIKAVFVETSVSDRNMKALIEGCQARGHAVTIGGTLFSDAMGDAGTPEATYIGMVRHNVRTIVKALR